MDLNASWLFTFGVSSLGVKANKNGMVTYSFKSKDASDVAAFSDDQDRVTGRMSLEQLAGQFKLLFCDDRPDMSLSHWHQGRYYQASFEAETLWKKGDTFYIKSDSLIDHHRVTVLAHYNNPNRERSKGIGRHFKAKSVIQDASISLDALPAISPKIQIESPEKMLYSLECNCSGDSCDSYVVP